MRPLLHFLRELVNPARRARAVPTGRLAIVSILVFVSLFVVFTLSSMGVQLPFVSHPYVIKAWFDDADGLDASNGPQVSVAGVPEGQVTDVSYEHGRALVTMSLDSSARGRVFADAAVRVRPFNAANFLQVDIEPGHPASGPLDTARPIDATRSSIPVSTDQVFSVLDADTRAYLQILTEQVGTGLHGTGGTLGQAFAQLAPLTNEARVVGATLAARHRLISSLVGETNRIFATLGRRHIELAQIVPALTRLLSVTGARTREIETAIRRLPQVLTDASATTASVSRLAPKLDEAMARFAPDAAGLTAGLRATHDAIPQLRSLLGAAESLTRGTAAPTQELLSLSRHLRVGITPAISSYQKLIALIKAVIAHEQPIAHFTSAISGAFSTQDAYGVLARIRLLGIQTPTAEDLGLPASAAAPGPNGRSKLQTMLATALQALCRRSQPLACLTELITPGLPTSLVPAGRGLLGRLSPALGGGG